MCNDKYYRNKKTPWKFLLLAGLGLLFLLPLRSTASWNGGAVVGWGQNTAGQANPPAGLANVAAIAAGGSFSLALKTDGSLTAWGLDTNGDTTIPTGLQPVQAIAAGQVHALAFQTTGVVTAWGDNTRGQTTVPTNLGGVMAIAAGGEHSMALEAPFGTVVAWGDDYYGQSDVPSGLTGVTAIAAGDGNSLALKGDGTVVAWGSNIYGQSSVPAGLSGVIAIAAGVDQSLALKNDGTVVAWGGNFDGESTVPAGLTGVTAISAGYYCSLALKSDGTVVAWGSNGEGENNVPAGLSGVTAISAGGGHALALAQPKVTYPRAYGAFPLQPLAGYATAQAGTEFGPHLLNNSGLSCGNSESTNSENLQATMWSKTGVATQVGTGNNVCYAINDSGEVVGDALIGGNTPGAFRWTAAGGQVYLPTLVPNGYSIALDVNAAGQVAGVSAAADGTVHPVIWSATDQITDLGTFPSVTFSVYIDDAGDVAAANDTQVGFWPLGGSRQDVGFAPYPTSMSAFSRSGQIIGITQDGTQRSFPFSWTAAAGVQSFQPQSGTSSTNLQAVNKAGTVVGYEFNINSGAPSTQAITWNVFDQTPHLLPIPSGFSNSMAYAINDAGQILGSVITSGGMNHGFIWNPDGTTVDLGANNGGGAINNEGDVLGGSGPGFLATIFSVATAPMVLAGHNTGTADGLYSVTPTHTPGPPATVSITLTGSATQSDTSDTLSYNWQDTDANSSVGTSLTVTLTLPVPPQGSNAVPHHYTLTASDPVSGLSGSANAIVKVYPTPNQSPTANAGANQTVAATGAATSVTLNGSASSDPDGDALTFQWKDNGAVLSAATTSAPTVSLTSGTHTVTLVVTDTYGASSAASTVTISVVPGPTANAGGPYSFTATHTARPPTTVAGTLIGSGTAPTPHGKGYAWTATDGGPAANSPAAASTTVTFTAPAAVTTWHYRLTVTDTTTLLTASQTVAVTVNPTPNHLPVANAGPAQTVAPGGTSTSVTLNGSASSDADGDALTYQWKDNGTVLTGATTSEPVVSLTTGIHPISLVVTDTYGAASTAATTTVTVAVKPMISAVASSGVTTTATTISWTTDLSSDSTVLYGPTSAYGSSSHSAPAVTSHSVTLTGLTAGNAYHYQVQSAAGGQTTTSGDATFTTAPAPPIISGVQVVPTATSATVSWVTSVNAGTTVQYGVTTAVGNTIYGPGGSLFHSLMITGLTGGNTYYYDVQSIAVGGSAASGSQGGNAVSSFVTLAPAPVITSGPKLSGLTTTGVTVSWTTNLASSTGVAYGLASSYGSTSAGTSNVTSHSLTLTGLTAGTTYHYQVQSVRNGGSVANGQQVVSADGAFTTLTPPAITSGPTITAVGPGTVTIAWTTNVASSSTVTYSGASSGTATGNSNTTSHVVTLTGMIGPPAYQQPGGQYSYTVSSTTSLGTASSSRTFAYGQNPSSIHGITWSAALVYVPAQNALQLTMAFTNNTGSTISNLAIGNVVAQFSGPEYVTNEGPQTPLGNVANGQTVGTSFTFANVASTPGAPGLVGWGWYASILPNGGGDYVYCSFPQP